MDKLLFGISGLPIGSGLKKLNYASGIVYLKSIGLDAMELLFVRSVNVTDKNKNIILKTKLDNDFYLSAHGSHYINLNADEYNCRGTVGGERCIIIKKHVWKIITILSKWKKVYND